MDIIYLQSHTIESLLFLFISPAHYSLSAFNRLIVPCVTAPSYEFRIHIYIE